jgi:hypothetical protein
VPSPNPVAVSVQYTDPNKPASKPELLVAHVTVVDDAAGCLWLDGAKALKLELEYDYRWRGADDEVSAEYVHQARVSGALQHQLPVHNQVWFKGAADSGLVSVEQRYVRPSDGYSIEVSGSGAPLVDASVPDQIHAVVDLTSCRLMFFGYVGTKAHHIGKGQGGVFELDPKVGGMSFYIAGYDLGGQRSFGQERLLPVQMGGITGPDAMTPDTHHNFSGMSGTARIRWSLTPQ